LIVLHFKNGTLKSVALRCVMCCSFSPHICMVICTVLFNFMKEFCWYVDCQKA
jgi:hypothetical protein